MNIKTLLLVGTAGFFGTLARYGVAGVITTHSAFPGAATWAVNLLGSFAIGLVYGFFSGRLNEMTVTILTVGFLGGFTTYSAFSAETVSLVREGRVFYAGGYVLWMLVSCFALTAVGFWLGGVADR